MQMLTCVITRMEETKIKTVIKEFDSHSL
ncbi:hypothetical protein B1B04_09370 [Lysinibacillus sp. KCTC 33748]|nr:hypothetical protein B1B04_09370 [Lysinibacillus sp. KCTC 33748]